MIGELTFFQSVDKNDWSLPWPYFLTLASVTIPLPYRYQHRQALIIAGLAQGHVNQGQIKCFHTKLCTMIMIPGRQKIAFVRPFLFSPTAVCFSFSPNPLNNRPACQTDFFFVHWHMVCFSPWQGMTVQEQPIPMNALHTQKRRR
jgi:hypothetical protein